jgi:hypothetical protein
MHCVSPVLRAELQRRRSPKTQEGKLALIGLKKSGAGWIRNKKGPV